jgi:ATP-dependent RNA helicase RhlE
VNFESFNFDRRIADRVRQLGFKTPTPIQEKAIPQVLTGRDLVGLAQTGTGKTAAFMLPILQRLRTGSRRQPRALILAPTRELAEQIHQMTNDLGRNLKVHSLSIYGGVSKPAQISKLRRGVDIVIACPGRLLDIASDRAIDLSKVEVVVLDEADRMCDMGFLPDVRRILKLLPKQRQTLFFSATMPDDIRRLAASILNNPITVQIGQIAPAKTVRHALYPVPTKRKKALLLSLLKRTATGRVLVFTRTKYRARNLARDLAKSGYRAAALQGNMSQNARQRAIKGFRDGRFDILAATDVASRGIDVAEISHVINYDMPDTVDAYTHRIGRTGRAHESGEAFTFVSQDDELMVRDIERVVGAKIERRRMSDFNYGASEAGAQKPANKPAPPKNGNRNSRRRNGNRPRHNRRSR